MRGRQLHESSEDGNIEREHLPNLYFTLLLRRRFSGRTAGGGTRHGS